MHGDDLRFGAVTRSPDVRVLDEMRSLLLDDDFSRSAENRPLYYMYRDLYKEQHKQTIRDRDLRFDITVIPNARLGREYVKTKGHYHPENDHGVPYPEMYEVLDGTAHYLLQREDGDSVDDVILVEASAGDTVIIPPGYGHITINPGTQPLKMANWVSTRFESRYGPIEANDGGAYFETITDEFVPNKAYGDLPDLRFCDPTTVQELGITPDRPMYELIDSPDNLAFLNRPHKFQWLFDRLY